MIHQHTLACLQVQCLVTRRDATYTTGLRLRFEQLAQHSGNAATHGLGSV
jgi:hypothetical protein